MNTISIDSIVRSAPSKWEEMTAEHLLIWVKLCAKRIDPDIALRMASKFMYGIKKRTFLKLVPNQQIQLAGSLAFLTENKLYKWLIPEIRIGRVTLYGPSDRFSSSSILEYNTTEAYYAAYKLTGKEEYLNQLIAAMYRPKSTDNNGKDFRRIFSEVTVLEYAKAIGKLDRALKAAILFNYEGCRSFVANRYPTVFMKGKDDGKAQGLPDMIPLIKIVAGGKFGSFKETQNADLYVFLDHIRDEKEAWEKSQLNN